MAARSKAAAKGKSIAPRGQQESVKQRVKMNSVIKSERVRPTVPAWGI